MVIVALCAVRDSECSGGFCGGWWLLQGLLRWCVRNGGSLTSSVAGNDDVVVLGRNLLAFRNDEGLYRFPHSMGLFDGSRNVS